MSKHVSKKKKKAENFVPGYCQYSKFEKGHNSLYNLRKLMTLEHDMRYSKRSHMQNFS